jgi:UDP-N-acetylmuramoyl-L-alanyl-D-glutamate--2,6-diaminopimelate ligase
LTLEDPRSEDVNEIINQIAQGALTAGKEEDKTLFRENDRTKAIELAILELAQPHDVIMITGKGPEKSMNIAGVEYSWDEFAVTKKILEKVT